MRKSKVVDKILNYHPILENYQGCDGYKSGFEDEVCTGIAAALVPTVEVIHKAVSKGCNLLIVHEPCFYQGPDFAGWRGSFANSVYEEKARLIEENHLTIWRDHDHMHAHCPDSIFTGVIKYLGWEEYYRPEMAGGLGLVYPFEIPQTTVGALGEFLKSKLCLNGLRFLGRKDDRITRVAIAGHLYPNCFFKDGIDEAGYYRDYSMQIMELMEKENGIEAIIPGEVVEWTVLAYIRDAVAQGKVRACMNIGHFNMEELGMRYAKDWLEELTGGKVAVHYIPTGDGYCYL